MSKLLRLLKDHFGHEKFRFNQEKIVTSLINGKDCLAIMPTGGGKSICYQLPALYLDGVTLVISPLISLMRDQVLNLQEEGIQACYLNSSQTYEQKQDCQRDIISGKIKIVYLSPEGLVTGALDYLLKKISISLIAIDEAHCVSGWGHEFRSDYKRLGELKKRFKNVPIIALTATADEKTRQDICHQLNLQDPKVFISSFDRPNIKYLIAERRDEMDQLNEFIHNNFKDDTGIVYCLSRKKVEKITQQLKDRGHRAYAYHAGLSNESRDETQNKFSLEDNIIIVATVAFGMGIDRPDVRFVAHLDLPKSIEGYYQETGRAGRDGLPSTAWMIYGLQDVVKLSQMLESTNAHESYKKVARFKLDCMLSLCETLDCRRQNLLKYFGEELSEKCGHCDACLYPSDSIDATIDAQKILSTIFHTGQIYGAGHLIDVLKGSKNAKVLKCSHQNLSVYGIGSDRDKNYWNFIIRQLLHLDYIQIINWEYRSLALTAKSKELLSSKKKLLLRRQKINTKKTSDQVSKACQDHGRPELFQQLRDLRYQLAREKKVPPYLIFSDRSLHEMCLFLPQNKDQFLLVNGVGLSKQEKYAGPFIKEIAKFNESCL